MPQNPTRQVHALLGAGLFLGFIFGQIGNNLAKYIERKNNSSHSLARVIAFIAGAIPGLTAFFLLVWLRK